ncbi:MAG: HEAT repeat domain-containing protein [Candidatus Eisenbacteria bacterium]|nr:HEAT repeat domain-containing protein [Candidatus Eisenbacteria bacterium]
MRGTISIEKAVTPIPLIVGASRAENNRRKQAQCNVMQRNGEKLLMTVHALRSDDSSADPEATLGAAAASDASAWLGQLVRTLKTCRLYDKNNPTVIRFREDLATSLITLIGRVGALRLEVGTSTLVWSGNEVLVAQARNDNLAGVLHRDGIRVLSLEPGIEARELDALVDLILMVTGPTPGEDDLVTLLWDADLPHVTIETVPLDGEADGGSMEDSEESPVAAWPTQESGGVPAPMEGGAPEADPSRSDDWTTGDCSDGPEQSFDELESQALSEIARFQQEQEAWESESIVIEALRFLEDCFANDLTDDDRHELAAFIPRVLRESLALGDWSSATAALRMVRTCDPQWTGEQFTRDLCGPLAMTTRQAVSALDRQNKEEGVESFLVFARQFGAPLAEWLMHVLAASQDKRVRRPLARTIGELLAGQPERVLPWLSDERWYVVRNAVHILGWIGGNSLAEHLRPVAEHPESRVRREVAATLSQCDNAVSRPALMAMLDRADQDLFGTILHQLAQDDDDAITEKLLALMRDEAFRGRSNKERRALFLALASRGERILPMLEEELFSGGTLFHRRHPDHAAIALCIARIGTPAARAILERGLHSKNTSVRKACLISGASEDGNDD